MKGAGMSKIAVILNIKACVSRTVEPTKCGY